MISHTDDATGADGDATMLEADFVVLGAGMAGLTAAGYAASLGFRVIVLEKAPDVGGSAVLSGSTIWTAPDLQSFQELCPRGNDQLGEVLFTNFPAAVEWIRSTGAEVYGPRVLSRSGSDQRFDIIGYLKRCQSVVEAAGGWVLTGQRVRELQEEDGRVVGVVVEEHDGEVRIAASATILATGGFQASSELRQRYFGANADEVLLRSNPHSTGDGLRLAGQLGVEPVGNMSAFYGHLIAHPLRTFGPAEFRAFNLSKSAEGVVLNAAGRRFTDESLGDHVTAQALSRQPGACGLLVVDQQICAGPARRNDLPGEGANMQSTLADAERRGAHVASASTLEELGTLVGAWGFDGEAVARGVQEFNNGLSAGSGGVPRRWNYRALSALPYWAVEVRPGVTFTQGGLPVDTQARVLRTDGSAVGGLYAAGADVGGVYEGGYAGGLALSIFGLQAVKTALADLQPASSC